MPPTSIKFEVNGTPLELFLPEKTNNTLASVFLVGLPKAGSTLLNRIMSPLCAQAGLTPFSLSNEIRSMGLPMTMLPANTNKLYDPSGYAYVGYRSLSIHTALPAFASGRIVFLVRDPRDMLVSQYYSIAFSHRPPGTKVDTSMADKFEAQRQEIAQTSIDAYVINAARTLLRNFESTQDQLATLGHRVWRYEDVIFEKQRWAREMLDYLNLNVRDHIITRVVEKHDILPAAENKNDHIRRVTPGDHKDKLRPETIEQLDKIFGDVLSTYNYA